MINRNGIVKVMDFGIAKVLGGQRLTRTGAQMGTVAYMSPEQIYNQSVDTRSDIYSLGVTLYEMLTGQLPFTSQSEFQLMSAHVNTPPRRPSRYCAQIPRGIDDAVLKALEKNPNSRFQTVEEFGAALEHPEGLSNATPRTVAEVPAASQAPLLESAMPAHSPPRKVPLVSKPSPLPKRAPVGVFRILAGPSRASAATRYRTQAYKFSALAFGVAGLFCLLFGALYRESIPMLLVFVVLLYFLPILVAAMLRKRNGASVVRLNTLRGWTGVGWLKAVKQALADDD
jgi:serine/threonine protein kinase